MRFPGAGHEVVRRHRPHRPHRPHRRRPGNEVELAPDPALGTADDRIDMIVGEVKEGRAELNRGARDPHVLKAVLTRFGCSPPEMADRVVQDLLAHGVSDLPPPYGYRTRLVAFGARSPEPLGYPCQVISLSQVIRFTQGFLREHWDILRHAPSKDLTMGLLMTMEKARNAEEGDIPEDPEGEERGVRSEE